MNLQKRQPSNFKEVLIFVAGTTPQIITETIYGLIHKEQPIYPDEIYILTTKHGEKTIKEKLISSGLFGDFCKEFNLSSHILDEDSIKVITEDGKELDDIKDWNDSKCAADFIVNFIREKSEDMTARLHCSIAGGRKTMSFYLGFALQLFGRHWDKLYHVLVTPEFESNPKFFFKPKKDTLIECRMQDGTMKKLHTKNAEIILVELPFIRLRHKFTLSQKSFSELVIEGQREIDIAMMQPQLKVILKDRTIYIGEKSIVMAPMELFIYTVFLRQKTNKCRYKDKHYCLDCTDCFENIYEIFSRPALEEFLPDYERIYKGQPFKSKELLYKWKEGISPEVIRQKISKIKNILKGSLPDETFLSLYTINSIRKYSSSRYGVRVEKEKITIE